MHTIAVWVSTSYKLVIVYVCFTTLQIAKLIQSMANKHVVGSHFKEEHMQPLRPFAMRHVNEIQVSSFRIIQEDYTEAY